MGTTNDLQKIPSDIKYYLLSWKDRNLKEYLEKYGNIGINSMSMDQIHELFSYATTKDGALLARLATQ